MVCTILLIEPSNFFLLTYLKDQVFCELFNAIQSFTALICETVASSVKQTVWAMIKKFEKEHY